jgi:hypothetical protein
MTSTPRCRTACATLLLLASSCATVWKQPTTQAVFIDSDSLGTPVSIDGARACVTMCTQKLMRRKSHTVVLTRANGRADTVQVRRSVVPKWLALDLSFGLGIGALVDYVNGRLFQLSPTDITDSLSGRRARPGR